MKNKVLKNFVIMAVFVFIIVFLGWNTFKTLFSNVITNKSYITISQQEIENYVNDYNGIFFSNINDFKGKKTASRDPIYLCNFNISEPEFEKYIENNKFTKLSHLQNSDICFVKEFFPFAKLESHPDDKQVFFYENFQMIPAKILIISKVDNDIINVTLCIICL